MYSKCSSHESIVKLPDVNKSRSKLCVFLAHFDSVWSSTSLLLLITSNISLKNRTQNIGNAPRQVNRTNSVCRLMAAVIFVNKVDISCIQVVKCSLVLGCRASLEMLWQKKWKKLISQILVNWLKMAFTIWYIVCMTGSICLKMCWLMSFSGIVSMHFVNAKCSTEHLSDSVFNASCNWKYS